jgi:hypothetical protein
MTVQHRRMESPSPNGGRPHRHWVLPDEDRTRLRKEVGDWFLEQGVPQLAGCYLPEDRLRYLVIPLAVLAAFEIGAAPHLDSTLLPLLVVPPVVVALLAWARPFLWRLLGLKEDRAPGATPLRLAGLVATLVALLALIVLRTRWPGPWSDPWFDFGAILLAELTAIALFTRNIWVSNDRRLGRLRRLLALLTIGATGLLAFQAALEEGPAISVWPVMGKLVPGAAEPPLAMPALAWLLLILILARLASQAADAGAPPEEEAPPLAALCYPAVPLLVLVVAAQTTVLRRTDSLGWMRVGLPLASLAVLFALSFATRKRPTTTWWARLVTAVHGRPPQPRPSPPAGPRPAWDRLFQGAGHPLIFGPMILAALVGYAVRVGADIEVQVFGWRVLGGVAAASVFVAYAVGVFVFVWFGLDSIAIWILREIRHHFLQILRGIAGGLSLLLVFATFLALTAETWQVVVEAETTKFLALVGLIVGLTLGVLVVLALQQLGQAESDLEAETQPEDPRDDAKVRDAWEADWGRVREHALRLGPSRRRSDGDPGTEPGPDPVAELFDATPPERLPLSPALTSRMRVNALLVIAVYQALVLVPVGVGAMVLFWGVGRLAVPGDVAAQWIYGDNVGPEGAERLANLSFWGEPWTRVPMVLAAFSVLYLTVTLLTSEDERKWFFSAANAALQQRLAIRIAYHLRLSEEERPDRPAARCAPAPGPQPAKAARAAPDPGVAWRQ